MGKASRGLATYCFLFKLCCKFAYSFAYSLVDYIAVQVYTPKCGVVIYIKTIVSSVHHAPLPLKKKICYSQPIICIQ